MSVPFPTPQEGNSKEREEREEREERGHPYMTSALRGEGVSPKEDVVREVA